MRSYNFVDYLCVKYNKFKNTSGVGNWMPYPPFKHDA